MISSGHVDIIPDYLALHIQGSMLASSRIQQNLFLYFILSLETYIFWVARSKRSHFFWRLKETEEIKKNKNFFLKVISGSIVV